MPSTSEIATTPGHLLPESNISIVSSEPETDHDSAYESDGSEVSTETLHEAWYDYRKLCGRTYHAGNQWYPYPNDEQEVFCLDLQHEIYLEMLEGELCRSEISSTPRRVLDIGTGSGVWALQFADKYPSTIVQGIDISPIQPNSCAPNCEFVMEDANSTWANRQKFDFIHCREPRMCIGHVKLFGQAFEALLPGGWFEIVEMMPLLTFPDDSLNGTPLQMWNGELKRAIEKCDDLFTTLGGSRQLLERVGFQEVHEIVYDIALNSKEETIMELGAKQMEVLRHVLEGRSAYLFREILGWPKDSFDILIAQVRGELRSRNPNAVVRFVRYLGQKPMSSMVAPQPSASTEDPPADTSTPVNRTPSPSSTASEASSHLAAEALDTNTDATTNLHISRDITPDATECSRELFTSANTEITSPLVDRRRNSKRKRATG